MPEPAPVITATLPTRRFICPSPGYKSRPAGSRSFITAASARAELQNSAQPDTTPGDTRSLEFAKVCYADNPTWNGVVFNLGEFALTACQPRSR
jgi:hypothetical protein